MPITPISGFITKKEAAESYQRSHRQLTRDLADAMKIQDPKVLDNCRVRTEDGELLDGMGMTPKVIDQLCDERKNPVWYLRTAWLEKQYGRRGGVRRPNKKRTPEEFVPTEGEGSDTSSRPEMVHVLRERIRGLEQDKQDMRDELKVKNQQIADRIEREKETNSLIRDLHTLMADLQGRLLPPPVHGPQQSPVGLIDSAPASATSAPLTKKMNMTVEATPSKASAKKGTRPSAKRRKKTTKKKPSRAKSRRTEAPKKRTARKTKPTGGDTPPATKSRSLWSRLFSQ